MPDDAIERAREFLADELVRRGDDLAARGVRNGSVEMRVEACLAAMLAFASQQAPEGWVLVPREPTEEMIDAGDFVAVRHFVAAGRYNAEVWSAMLAAASSVTLGEVG